MLVILGIVHEGQQFRNNPLRNRIEHSVRIVAECSTKIEDPELRDATQGRRSVCGRHSDAGELDAHVVSKLASAPRSNRLVDDAANHAMVDAELRPIEVSHTVPVGPVFGQYADVTVVDEPETRAPRVVVHVKIHETHDARECERELHALQPLRNVPDVL